ncbi:hypothetical protein [Flectobacillus sp. BAB-3569]|uniref:hypothetical protein n=1 Tax=Flectobacillus sp. BAB-3569 TaxID=1509483 RepID=UPI0015956963|nr:hypothetical protein [Flectobacillus sp. BAB-3569]
MKKVCFALMLVAGVIFNMTAQEANPLKGKKILVFSKTAASATVLWYFCDV